MSREVGASVPERAATRALRGLIEVSRLARSGGSLAERLDALAGRIADSLGYSTVVITLYRPAWDDFNVAAVSGRPEARRTLLGCTRTWETYGPLLDERFLRRGAYVIPAGAHDWDASGTSYTPPIAVPDDPNAWHPDDVVLLPLTSSDGTLLGVLSVDEPANLRRPDDDELDVLTTLAEHVALSIEDAQADAVSDRYRASLQNLLSVSSRLLDTLSVDDILSEVAEAIQGALGFERVSVELAHPLDGAFHPRASAGWGSAGPPPSGLTRETIQPLFDPEYEIEGCYLLPYDVARSRVHLREQYATVKNGAGPRAWERHWLVIPLVGRDAALQGFIWVDDPTDRLLPSREKVQALRLFANQATTALDAAARFEELEFLADHDPLTRLPNRRAFVRQLDAEVSRSQRYGHAFALVVCDLDNFKELNDRAGHLVGDDQLVRFAARLESSVRRADFAFRIGGDEFALVLVEAGEEDARRVIERVTASVSDGGPALAASFGIAVYDQGGTADDLFRRADAAMYDAKRSSGEVAVSA